MENERTKYTACPLCSSPDIRFLTNADCTHHHIWREPLEPFITWMTCGSCEHIFTNGYFTDEALNVLFGNTQDIQLVGNDVEAHRNISSNMVQRVVDRLGLPNDRLWLDVGFGNGSLLMTAKEFGFDVFGVDLRKKNVDDIQTFGIAAHYGTVASTVSQNVLPGKATVISMADVVEHEPFPIEALRTARSLMTTPGLLLISMPNANAPLWHYWNANHINPYWQEIEHYHNFTRERLYALLEKAGFRPCHYTTSQRYRCCMEVLAEAV